MTRLAVFDFDGTITDRDTLLDFMRFALGNGRFYWGMLKLSPVLIAFKLKLIRNDRAKQRFITQFMTTHPEAWWQEKAQAYTERIERLVRPGAAVAIRAHKSAGDRCVVVSASMALWVNPWCKQQGLELISTQLETQENHFTGRFATPNCYGPEKVVRLKSALSLEAFEQIVAYGDSRGDRELLALAHKSYFKPFR